MKELNFKQRQKPTKKIEDLISKDQRFIIGDDKGNLIAHYFSEYHVNTLLMNNAKYFLIEKGENGSYQLWHNATPNGKVFLHKDFNGNIYK